MKTRIGTMLLSVVADALGVAAQDMDNGSCRVLRALELILSKSNDAVSVKSINPTIAKRRRIK